MFDSTQGRVRRVRFEPLVEKGAPVVRGDVIQIGYDLVEIVGQHLRRSVAADGEKLYTKVVQRFLVAGQLANGGIGIQPYQLAFLIVVLAAPPIAPVRVVPTENLTGDGRVFEVAPRTTRLNIKPGGAPGERFAVDFGRPKSRACREHVSPVLRHALVDPEQIALLRR